MRALCIIILACLFQNSYAETRELYLIKWKKNLTQSQLIQFKKFTKAYRFKRYTDQWKIELSKSEASGLLKLGVVDFLEKDEVLSVDPILEPNRDTIKKSKNNFGKMRR